MIPFERPKHILITPFYVRRHFKGHAEPRLAPPSWLDGRFPLFESYCLPSVLAQSSQSFKWLIYFDAGTPEPYLDRVRRLVEGASNVSLRFCDVWTPQQIVAGFEEELPPETEWLMTTRLDNDDALHRDFVEQLQAAAEPRMEFLNFPNGIILYRNRCYLYAHASNAFLTLVEPAPNPRTVFSVAHEEASTVARVRQLDGNPAFLQVVHGGNVSNKPRGTWIEARAALAGFEALPALRNVDFADTRLGILLENATRGMFWRIRDQAILIAKAIRRH